MQTQCNEEQLEFQGLGKRVVVGAFDGGTISSDGGVALLREADARLGLCARLAECFTDLRREDRVEHAVVTLVRQRVFGLAAGYEDLNDHDALSRDPLWAVAVGVADVEGRERLRTRDAGRSLAGKSTLNRLELTPQEAKPGARYQKITHDAAAMEALLTTLLIEAHAAAPDEIVLDFDATDFPLHGHQEGRFFHGYYDTYCYLPLYVTCGSHVLAARLRTADRDAADGAPELLRALVARIRAAWPATRILVRADSGFAREALFTTCEELGLYYLTGLAKNTRLLQRIGKELVEAKEQYTQTKQAARCFTHFHYQTHKSWSRARRVIAKAEHLSKGANPRFIVTNLPEDYACPKDLYEKHYCARGDMENRIKEQQLDLFASRTSTAVFRANQLRLTFATFAYTLMNAMRQTALQGTRLARATVGTIRLALIKIGVRVETSVRRVRLYFSSACPNQDLYRHAFNTLRRLPQRC